MLWHKRKAAGLVLCFPADILLITADSRLENCWSWMPRSECVQSQMRRGEVSSLLVRAWVEADPIFPMRPCQFRPPPLLLLLPPISSSSSSSPSSCSTWHLWTPLHLLIMLRKILFCALIRSQPQQLHSGGPLTTTEEICCLDGELYDRWLCISAAKVRVLPFLVGVSLAYSLF